MDHLKDISLALGILIGLSTVITLIARQARFAERIISRLDEVEREMKLCRNVIFNTDGRMNVLTHTEHEKIAAACQARVFSEIGHHTDTVAKIEKCVNRLADKQSVFEIELTKISSATMATRDMVIMIKEKLEKMNI